MKVSRLLLGITLLVSSSTFIAAQNQSISAGNPLADTEWMLTSFGVGNVGNPLIAGTTITLKFGSDGRVGGSGGCNSFGGNYSVSGNTVSISRVISTRRACVNAGMNQQEQRFLRALESVETFRLSGNSLVIFHDDGRNRLQFMSTLTSEPVNQRYEDLSSPVTMLASFYNAINTRDYERALGYWESPPSGLDAFARGYRNTTKVRLLVQPPTRIEGAAGSVYAELPILVTARQRNGNDRIFFGCYVIRKTNRGVVGNPAVGNWRIYRAKLFPISSITSIPHLLEIECEKM